MCIRDSNQIDYSLQLARLTALYERFRPRAIVAEANSMGQPLIEQLLSLIHISEPTRPY